MRKFLSLALASALLSSTVLHLFAHDGSGPSRSCEVCCVLKARAEAAPPPSVLPVPVVFESSSVPLDLRTGRTAVALPESRAPPLAS